MNKNTLIGTVLMCLIFMAMVWTSQPSAEQLEAQRRAQDSIARLQTEAIENSMNAGKAASEEPQDSLALAQADSIKQALRQQKYGNIAAAATGEEKIINLSNNVLSVDISSKGGVLQKATLLEYENYKDEQLVLFDAKNNHQHFTFYSVYGKYITTEDLYFTPLAKTDSSVVMPVSSTSCIACRLTAIFSTSPSILSISTI